MGVTYSYPSAILGLTCPSGEHSNEDGSIAHDTVEGSSHMRLYYSPVLNGSQA
jgi:hypothetical protein